MSKDSEDTLKEINKTLLSKPHDSSSPTSPKQSIETSVVEIDEDTGCFGCLHALYTWMFIE